MQDAFTCVHVRVLHVGACYAWVRVACECMEFANMCIYYIHACVCVFGSVCWLVLCKLEYVYA